MKIAIVDDSDLWRQKIRRIIENCGQPGPDEFISGEELLKKRRGYDAVFLDVEMQGRDGFETALAYQDLFPDSYILILTMHAELSRKGYLVNAFRYIDKNYMEDEIPEALESLGLLFENGQMIELKVYHEGILRVSDAEIICAETVPHGVIIHTIQRDYRAAISIGDLSSMLDPDHFFRSHNSWLIGWKYVIQLEDTEAIMKNGIRAMISRKQQTEAKKRFWEYKFRRAHG